MLTTDQILQALDDLAPVWGTIIALALVIAALSV